MKISNAAVHLKSTSEINEESFEINTIKLREKCPNTEFFLARMRENTDQKKLRIWTLFTQCQMPKIITFAITAGEILSE